ncbi:carbohydrate ABC transporter permease, partial [Eubacteriales bacterium OttesenSCG-928-K08]|nr:carbohydrate ABC transporter permease [Eubacteriales bacterium OttesenSCG-928-K08]
KANNELFTNVWSPPKTMRWDNYVRAWTNGKMADYFGNTVIIMVSTLTVLMVFGSMASYALARYKHYKWVRLLLLLFIVGMSIPAQITLVPLYLTFSSNGLLNTYIGLILVYCAVYMPFTVFVLSGFFEGIPREIEQAALIDGCHKFGTFWRIAIPMAKPGLVTVLIFNFLSVWNEYFYAMVLVTDPKKMPLSAGLYNLKSQQQMSMDWAALFAGVVILLIPTLIMFFLMQKKIAKGITEGAIKG